MAEDGKGWNQLKRNKSSFKTDNFEVNGISIHDTITVDKDGNIIKGHTKVTSEGKSFRTGFSGGSGSAGGGGTGGGY